MTSNERIDQIEAKMEAWQKFARAVGGLISLLLLIYASYSIGGYFGEARQRENTVVVLWPNGSYFGECLTIKKDEQNKWNDMACATDKRR